MRSSGYIKKLFILSQVKCHLLPECPNPRRILKKCFSVSRTSASSSNTTLSVCNLWSDIWHQVGNWLLHRQFWPWTHFSPPFSVSQVMRFPDHHMNTQGLQSSHLTSMWRLLNGSAVTRRIKNKWSKHKYILTQAPLPIYIKVTLMSGTYVVHRSVKQQEY